MSLSLRYGKEAENTELSIKLRMIALMLKPKHLHRIENFREDGYQFCFLFLNFLRILFLLTHPQRLRYGVQHVGLEQESIMPTKEEHICVPLYLSGVFIYAQLIYGHLLM